nr:hypothetical protein [Tanacetum cinerariifolium]
MDDIHTNGFSDNLAFLEKLILPKKTKQPTCEDALAALVKQPVNKKKRTKRVECEQAESSHVNEQLQTVCWDPLANQHNKPDKKKMKIPPKVDRGRVNKKNRTKRVECEEAKSNHANEQLQIVCWDPLANQHNKPDKKKMKIPPKVDRGRVNKKNRTKRVECEEAKSNHANEQLQIVCWDPLANQHNEPDKKKRRIRPKVDRGPVVKNEVTERLQKFITDEINGSNLNVRKYSTRKKTSIFAISTALDGRPVFSIVRAEDKITQLMDGTVAVVQPRHKRRRKELKRNKNMMM